MAGESKRLQMPEEKSKRIAVGATVGGVLLLIVLLAVIIIQFVQMGVKQRTLRELNDRITEKQQKLDETERDFEFYQSEFGIYSAALKQGWIYPDD